MAAFSVPIYPPEFPYRDVAWGGLINNPRITKGKCMKTTLMVALAAVGMLVGAGCATAGSGSCCKSACAKSEACAKCCKDADACAKCCKSAEGCAKCCNK